METSSPNSPESKVTDNPAYVTPWDIAARALADTYGRGRRDGGLYVHYTASDGFRSFRSATPDEAADTVIGALIDAGVISAEGARP